MATYAVLTDTKSAQRTLREMARDLRQEIHSELLRADEERYIEIAGRVHDVAEASVADLLVDLNIAAVGRQINELRAVEAALQRISMGNYAVCEHCGESIGVARLSAQPAASRCIKCQNHIEKQYGQLAHPTL